MKHLFIPYELALLAKEKGFKEECLGDWQNLTSGYNLVINDEEDTIYDVPVLGAGIAAPLYQQIIDWFREKHKIDVRVFPMYSKADNDYKTCWGWNLIELEWGKDKEHHIANSVSTREYELNYYQSITKAIEEAFKLI